MANRILSSNSNYLTKLRRSIRFFTRSSENINFRNYSNQGWKRKNTYVEQVLFGHTGDKQISTVWPDPNLGILGAKDSRFSLPGNIGVDSSSVLVPSQEERKITEEELRADKKLLDEEFAFWRDLVDSPTNHQRQLDMLKHHERTDRILEEEMEKAALAVERQKLEILEVIPQSCPDLIRRELTAVFGSASLATGSLTVITFCHKTKNDMSAWSPDVEEERNTLLEFFMRTAKELCRELRNRAQWADFIDPSSGRPFYAPYTNLTFFETDERYRSLGFRVVDLGCCKVISHLKWGTHAFVGSIFTTAPHDSAYLEDICKKCNERLN